MEGASFRTILAAYRQQPQARGETYKAVSLRAPGPLLRADFPEAPTADIIGFYNQASVHHIVELCARLKCKMHGKGALSWG